MNTLDKPPASDRPPTGRRWSHRRNSALVLLCSSMVVGCALKPPAPWERGDLARPAMALQTDPLEARLQQHLYSSKENASGGSSIGGGGCGCN